MFIWQQKEEREKNQSEFFSLFIYFIELNIRSKALESATCISYNVVIICIPV
jgi:hypothetical protein